MNPETVYKQRIEEFDAKLKKLKRQDTILGVVKLLVIVCGLLGLFRVFSDNATFSLGLFAFCLVLFTTAVFMHETVIGKIKYLKTLKTINENEIKILYHEFPRHSDTGEEFSDNNHNYTSDLDIFGEKSIFHYVNRAVTAMGRQCLAGWLKTQAGIEEIKKRQEAAKELSQKVDFRQAIAAHGLSMDDSSKKLESLYKLLDEPFFILGKKFFVFFIYFWPVVTFGAFVLSFFSIPLAVPLGLVLSQMLINKKYDKNISGIYRSTTRSHKILKAYSRIIEEIEKEQYTGEKLDRLKEKLSVADKRASVCIRRLSTLLEWFDVRGSVVHFVANFTVLWDLHCVYRLEKWRKGAASHVPRWFEVIGEIEALSGFSALYFNNPQWTMPEIFSNGGFQMEAVDLGHPLIPRNQRICNHIEVNAGGKERGTGNTVIVTGPNMAGKSTFLRSVGVNIALAFAGAPVCASRFRISPIKLFSSMQTSDSLDKHLSLFYAELQRLKKILDGISGKLPVFFLIDEMLKGTNALDRQKGAIAMVKQLTGSGANGIVATHDLELTKLEGPHISNYHFDGYIEGDKLLFDYLLKKGTCKSFNALVLMKNMGIDL